MGVVHYILGSNIFTVNLQRGEKLKTVVACLPTCQLLTSAHDGDGYVHSSTDFLF